MVVDIYYPNDDDPRKERPVESIIDDVQFYLDSNTKDGGAMYSLNQIAHDQGVEDFRTLVAENKPLQEALEKFIDLNEQGAFQFYENRADVNFVALLVSESIPKDPNK